MIRELAIKTLQQEIEDMRAHVKDLTGSEQTLVKALGDELRRSDEDLLHAIRAVAATTRNAAARSWVSCRRWRQAPDCCLDL
jgi:hypothetical protein